MNKDVLAAYERLKNPDLEIFNEITPEQKKKDNMYILILAVTMGLYAWHPLILELVGKLYGP